MGKGRITPSTNKAQAKKPVALTRRKHGVKRARVLANALAMSQLSLGNR